jgi:hypothetical protein
LCRALSFGFHGQNNVNPGLDVNGTGNQFGADDEDLVARLAVRLQQLQTDFPDYTWTFSPNPSIAMYLKLDKTNVLDLLNNPHLSPEQFYLDFSPGGNMEALAQWGESPRNTFPTDLGTDGQRDAGPFKVSSVKHSQAARYLSILFAQTSNRAFKDILADLNADRLTVRGALDKAKRLV